MNNMIKAEKQRHQREKTSVVKKLFDDEPEVELGDSGGSLPVED